MAAGKDGIGLTDSENTWLNGTFGQWHYFGNFYTKISFVKLRKGYINWCNYGNSIIKYKLQNKKYADLAYSE